MSNIICKRNLNVFFLFFCILIFSLSLTTNVFAAVSITTATGGTNISADKAANATSPAYTTLGNIVISENINNDINPNGTFTVQPPTGWEFNSTGVTTSVTGGLTVTVTSQTSSLLTLTIGNRNNGQIQSFSIIGLQVRAIDGASLPSSGNITRAGGTAGVTGITNGVTNLGSLSQTFGTKSKLVFTTQPSAIAFVNMDFITKPIVTAKDQFNNTVTSDTVAVTRTAVLSNQVCGGIAGSGSITSTPINGANAVSGVMAYTAMQYSAVEAIKICASSGTVSTTSNSVVVSKADQAALTAIATPSTVAYGSTATLSSSGGTGTGAVTFSAGASTGCSVLGTTLSVTDASGSCSIIATKAADSNYNATTSPAITVTLTPKNIIVTAASSSKVFGALDPIFTYTSSDPAVSFSGSLSRAPGESIGTYAITIGDLSAGSNYTITFVSANFTITAPAVTKFVITQATNGTIDLPSYVVIEAQNGLSETVTSYNQDVTLVTSGSATGGGLINIINGIGTTTISDEVVENVHLSLLDTEGTGLNVSSTADISFGPGETAKLSLSALNASLVAGERLPINVSRFDRLDNAITSGSETFYFYSNSTSPANKFYDASTDGNIVTSVLISEGSSEATIWYYDEIVGEPDITASDNSISPDGLTGVDDASINISVTSAPTSALLINDPGNLVAGNRLSYEVSRQDQFGNFSDNGSLTVHLYHTSSAPSSKFYDASIDGNVIESVSMPAGVASSSFWFYGDKAGSVSVTVSDNSNSPDGSEGVNDASDSFVITPGSVDSLSLNDPGNMTASTSLGYTVSRFDAFDNPISENDLTVYLYHDDPGVNTVFYDLAIGGNEITSLSIPNGSESSDFWFYSENPGNYHVTVSDNSTDPDGDEGINDATDSVSVLAIPIVATRFVIVDTTPTMVGDTAQITVEARDDSDNLDTSYSGSVTLHTSGSATVGGIVTIASGVGTINIIDTVAETVNLSLEDTAGSGLNVSSTNSIDFYPGPTASFVINDGVSTSTATAGDRTAYSIGRLDQYGNQVTSGVDTVYLYSNAPAGTGTFYNQAVDGTQVSSILILDGSNTANVWFSETKAGSWTVVASDNSTAPDVNGIIDGLSPLVVNPANTARLTLNDPGDMFRGTRLGYTVTRYDAYNNEVISGSDNFYLYSNSNSSSTAFYDSSVGGSPISTVGFFDGQATANFYYYENTNGIWTVYVSDNSSSPDGVNGIVDGEDAVIVSPVPIIATKFIIVVSSISSMVGDPIIVDVRVVDNDENIDTTYQNDVTLGVSGSATGGGLIDIVNGVGQAFINDLTAENVTLSLQDTQNTGLNVSFVQTINFSATPVIARGGGGGSTLITPSVFVLGRAFPGANVEIMAIQNGQVPVGGSGSASSNGGFNVAYSSQLPSSVNSFALAVYDKDQHISQTKILKLGVNDNLFTNVLMSPTVYLMQEKGTLGTFMGVTGKAMPNYKIELMIDGIKATETTVADREGNYSLPFNTYRLGLGDHTLRVRQIDNQGNASDYSIEKKFLIVKSYVPKADLNNDSKVDIQDWSIFNVRYKSTDVEILKTVDLNNDGKVDIKDMSLFIQALTQ